MTDKPKCPLKFRLQAFEGGEECDEKCMWLVNVYKEMCSNKNVCALTALAMGADYYNVGAVNWMEVDI